MQAYYNILTNLKAKLEADEFVNTVTQGDIFDIDLTKQTIFPLAHIIVNDVTKAKNILQFNVTVMCMDIVDLSKDETTDIFLGNDNEQDVLNTQLAVGLRLVELLESGSNNTQFMMRGEPTFEGFTERFENNIAGWAVTFDIHVPNTMTSCDDTATGVVCYPANYTVEYANGTLIESGTIASGGSVTVTVPNCPDIEDATWTLRDESGTTISTGTIASGGSATIVAPDATININGALWDTVESGGTENIIVRQSTGSTQVGSKQGQYYRISDSNIQNSDGSYNLDVKAENSLVLPDSQINVNSVNEGNVVSVKTIDVNLSDSSGTVTPDAIVLTGNSLNITLPDAAVSTDTTAQILKTFATTSYRAGDDGSEQIGRAGNITTLASNNLYGNTSRFLDTLGGSAYANDVVVDWSTYEPATGAILMVKKTLLATAPLSTQIASIQALTDGGFTDWKMSNINQLFYLCKKGALSTTSPNQGMNYAPFNFANVQIWSNTGVGATTALFIRTYSSSLIITGAEGTSYSGLAVRVGNVSELGF